MRPTLTESNAAENKKHEKIRVGKRGTIPVLKYSEKTGIEKTKPMSATIKPAKVKNNRGL